MKKGALITIVTIALAVVLISAGIFFFSRPAFVGENYGGCPDVQPGEYVPQRGECPGSTPEIQQKCISFCETHPSCCPSGSGNNLPGGQQLLSLPSDEEVSQLARNYPVTIKAVNEGPNIYSRDKAEIISNESLDKIKESGFNTVQVYLIGKWEGDKIVFNEYNNAVLLNDIVAIKNKGLAVWVALDMAGGPPVPGTVLAESYGKFKPAFLNLVNISSQLMERYNVEYLTVANEPDNFIKLQTSWGSESQIEEDIADFLPSTNLAARDGFKGKLINKITQPRKHTPRVIESSFRNVDIAGIDVGPPIDTHTTPESYKAEFADYQFYATEANKRSVSWMNAEYWQGDFQNYTDFEEEQELEYAKISFDEYLNVTPKGVGYTWNDLATFSLPQGEETRLALKGFLAKL